MPARNENRLSRVVFFIMKSIATAFLRTGLLASEAVESLKGAFVIAATELSGRDGKPASIAQVARVTGLTRKEAARLKSKFQDTRDGLVMDPDNEANLLTAWHTNPAYLDSSGNPLAIPFDAPGASFSGLVSDCLPNCDPETVLQNLLRYDCVERLPNGDVAAKKRNKSWSKGVDGAVVTLEYGLMCMAKTTEHNMLAKDEDKWVQRTVSFDDLDSAGRALVKRAVRDRAVQFCLDVDDVMALSGKASTPKTHDDEDEPTTVGVGVYYFEI